eukprot:4159381-Pleurochrysis_carterae.AAC.1
MLLLSCSQHAVLGSVVHPILTYVHAWDNYFRPAIYDSIAQISTARFFVIRQRADGYDRKPSPCMSGRFPLAKWFYSSHRNLHPSAKDENGNRIDATAVNGEKVLQFCEHGIEWPKSCLRRAPMGMSLGLADFAVDTLDTLKPRFNSDDARAN